jgi:LacI family transcriptional regulator
MNFDDPEVAFALRYIREHACDPISTADVLKVTNMSNSTAYRKFMKSLGHSIHNEIQSVQMKRMKKLLVSTNLNISAIAQQSGVNNVRYMTKIFRDATGCTPTEFRRNESTPAVS